MTGYGSTTYGYDGLGRIAARGSASFGYGGTETDPVSDGAQRFARSPAGDLVALAAGATVALAGANRHGDVSWLLSAAGSVTDTKVFGPYGQVAGSSGATGADVGFQGDWTDPVTGLVDMGRRWYQPDAGSFTARDAVFGELRSPVSLNRYTYANGDPLGYFDPDGQWGFSLKKWAASAWHAASAAYSWAAGAAVTAARWASAEVHAAGSGLATAARTVSTRAAAYGRAGARMAARAGRAVGRAVTLPVRACARSSTCRTVAVAAAVTAAAVVCTACAVGAAIGAGIGGGIGVATCHGDPACIARSAIVGAAGGAVAPIGGEGLAGALLSGALAGATTGAAGQTINGHYNPRALLLDTATGAATAGLLHGALGMRGPTTTATAAETGGAGAARSTNFIVHPNGDVVPIPKGAVGPTPVDSGKGFQFTGGSGGHGLDPRTTDVRIMDPVTTGKYQYPNGYVSYSNGSGQAVNPYTGQTVGKADPWWHWPF